MLRSSSNGNPKQIAAARANGAKSRGPVTVQGKRNSSRNSFTHGAFSRSHQISGAFLEFYCDRLAGFTAELQPDTPEERALVRRAALLS